MPPVRKEIETLPVYSPGMPVEEVKRRLGLDHIDKLASNENPLGPSPRALEAMKDCALHLYPEKNSPDLKKALAEHWGLHEGQVVVGNGADDLILRVAQTFLNPGETGLSSQGTFSQYRFATQLMGGVYKDVPLLNHRFHLEEIKKNMDSQTRLVFLCNPNNPTGTFFTRQELEDFLHPWPEEVLVVLDEAYKEYVEDKSYPQGEKMLQEYPQLILLRTFSKVYGLAGLRIGYALCHPQNAEYMERSGPPFAVNRLAQQMALMCLQDRAHFRRSQTLIWEQKQYLYQKLTELGLSYLPTQSNFILIETGFPAEEIFSALLAKGIIVRSGKPFGYAEAIRLTIGTFAENTRFLQAMEETVTEMRRK